MPPTKSSKTSKASKAAKAILHPKSTLAAAKASHSRNASIDDDDRTATSSASSIRKTPSNASIASITAKAKLGADPANGSPAAKTAILPTTPPIAPSVLAPPIGNDILSMKKQAIQRAEVAQKPPNSAPFAAPHTTASSAATHPVDVPYTIEEAPAATNAAAQNTGKEEQPVSLQTEAVSSSHASLAVAKEPQNDTSSDAIGSSTAASATPERDQGMADDKFVEEVAAAIASSDPAPNQTLPAAVVAAPTPLTLPIVSKVADKEVPDATSTSATHGTGIALSDAVAKSPVYTPPELTRLQHNTFVSRPSDPSRIAARSLEASALPAPLRSVDGQKSVARIPSHVVIFGWMDAPIRLVAKYAQPYTVLFPDATVLIQLSDGKSYLAREQVRRTQLQRIISEITSASPQFESKPLEVLNSTDVGDSTITLIDHKEARSSASSDGDADQASSVGGLVIHSFSDGGAGNLALFLDEMARRKAPSPRVHSLIMDSSPGKSNPKSGSFAFTMHLANRPRLRAVVRFLVYVGLYLLKIWTQLTGQLGRGELMRKRLNSLRSWSWVTASHSSANATATTAASEKSEQAGYPPRMYMYTKADRLIPWGFVEEHAYHLGQIRGAAPGVVQMENESERSKVLEAAKSGTGTDARHYNVELRRWDTPPHCSIGRSDFLGYWSAVMDFYSNVLSRP